MPRFSEFFELGLSQAQLDFVDISNEYDTPVYVDPYAIEIRDDIWSAQASEHIRSFFKQVLDALRDHNTARALGLMSNLREPRETFLGVSRGPPKGRGVGKEQAQQLIAAIRQSKAYSSGLLSDLSEMTLYVERIDKDKISDLTTNIIRRLLAEYTQQQCELYDISTSRYVGPPMWDIERSNWISQELMLPRIQDEPVLLVPKYIVRRRLSLDSQEFYNKQITDFLIEENIKANSSLVQTIKGKPKVYKGEVRKSQPKSKSYIADTVLAHPELLKLYKQIAKAHGAMAVFNDQEPTVTAICGSLATLFEKISPGAKNATAYHRLVLGSLTALFFPSLIQPHKEWPIHDGRKRVDIVFTNAADVGFFSHRRNDNKVNANAVIVECKNYSEDLGNNEIDQLLGRFDENRGRFGIITCRSIDDPKALMNRCRDASSRSQGYIIALTDDDLTAMLVAKSRLEEDQVEAMLHRKYRELLA
jgi:hypothetical protein